MIFPDIAPVDIVGALVAFVLTLLIFSYMIGDNIAFRLGVHIFIGISAGYAGGVVFHSVLRPYLFDPLISMGTGGGLTITFLDLGLRLLLLVLLLLKLSPRTTAFGNPATAFLVGIGAATAVGGAIQGTIFPQVGAATQLFNPDRASGFVGGFQLLFEGSIILLGTITTLAYFNFSALGRANQEPETPLPLRIVGWIGHGFIAITFGVIFAGVYTAALTALIERLFFLWDVIGFVLVRL
ncbi:MAG: hypothetical protein DWQ07_19855 [Chloroflexi bacterium]|nr:MAG: hypothetical protein DWQ07_19855 [Chloroflexota bacterium]MBL1194339.1 hypothetical protein [Chloroflexota bacterium]NOH11629.1 hypothetical protein [Chloroflexota bacterium]